MLQKEDGWCGPVALSYALKKYGKQVSQEKIAKETNELYVIRGTDAPLVNSIGLAYLEGRTFSRAAMIAKDWFLKKLLNQNSRQ